MRCCVSLFSCVRSVALLCGVVFGVASCVSPPSDPLSGVPQGAIVVQHEEEAVRPPVEAGVAERPLEPVRVVEYGPQGPTRGAAQIRVRFSGAVVALQDARGEEEAARKLLTIDPPVEGRARWVAPDLLTFTPTRSWPEAHTVRVSLNATIPTLGGGSIKPDLAWTFETERPHVESIAATGLNDTNGSPFGRVEEDTMDPKSAYAIHVNQETTVERLKPFVRVYATREGEKRSAVPFRLVVDPDERRASRGKKAARAASWFLVRPARGRWPLNAHISVQVESGWTSQRGPLPSETRKEVATHTARPLQMNVECHDSDGLCRYGFVRVDFLHKVPSRYVRSLRVTPKPKNFRVVSPWSSNKKPEGDVHTVVLMGNFDLGETYTVRVPQSLRDVHGQKLKGDGTASFTIQWPKPSLELERSYGLVRPDRPATVGFHSRYVRRARIRLAALSQEDVMAAMRAGADWSDGAKNASALWPETAHVDRVVDLNPSGETHWASTPIQLTKELQGVRGFVMLEVRAVEMVEGHAAPPEPVFGMYRVTELGVELQTSPLASFARVVSLSQRSPVPNASVRWFSSLGTKTVDLQTDTHGLALLPFVRDWSVEGGHEGSKELFAVVESADGKDWTVLRASSNPAYNSRLSDEKSLRRSESVLGEVLFERGVYKPGDVVHNVGWVTVRSDFVPSGVRDMPVGTEVLWSLTGPRGDVVATEKGRVEEGGKVWASMRIPKNAKLGRYRSRVEVLGRSLRTRETALVRDFRAPPFVVSVSVPEPDVIQHDPVDALTTARYLFGAPVVMGATQTTTRCSATSWRPAGLDRVWSVGVPRRRSWGVSYAPGAWLQTKAGEPPVGELKTSIDTSKYVSEFVQRCTVFSFVRDASLQTVSAETSFRLHPAPKMVAVKRFEATQRVGGVARLAVRAVDLKGRFVALQGVSLRVERLDRSKDGRREVPRAIHTCDGLNVGVEGDAECVLPKFVREGRYRVTAQATQGKQKAKTVSYFWVHKKRRPAQPTVPSTHKPPRYELRVSAKEAAPGESVDVVVRAPQETASCLLNIVSGGLQRVVPVSLNDGVGKVSVVLDASWAPKVTLTSSCVEPTKRLRTRSLSESVAISMEDRALQVKVRGKAEVGPGDRDVLEVEVLSAQGTPLESAQVAVWAVDESVLSLTEYELPDVAQAFVFRRGRHVESRDNLGDVIAPFSAQDEDPLLAEGGGGGFISGYGAGYGGGGRMFGKSAAGSGRRGGPQAARSRFETTPLFLGNSPVRNGRASVPVHWPDSLTTFRVFAVASQALKPQGGLGRFGHDETTVRVTAPLVIQAALPRAVRVGDSVELAMILTNRTDRAGRVRASLQVDQDRSMLRTTTPLETWVDLPPQGVRRVAFRADATGVGSPSLTFRASLEAQGDQPPVRDAMTTSLKISTEPTQLEHMALYTTLDDATPQSIPIRVPHGASSTAGRLSIDISPTLLSGLQDAVRDLIEYPYGCAEQTSSRLLPLVALRGLRASTGIRNVDEFVKKGVERLLSMQQPDGGFAYWPGGSRSLPYTSAYVTWVLWMASQQGAPVPKKALEQALAYLSRHIQAKRTTALDDVRAAIAVYTLSQAGRAPSAALDELVRNVSALPGFARALVAHALFTTNPEDPRMDSLRSMLLSDLVEDASTAHVRTRPAYAFSSVFHSSTREDAMVLRALLAIAPSHPVLPKLARGLLDTRRKGTWRNTQENAYALLALEAYARQTESPNPHFVVHSWVHEQSVVRASWAPSKAAAPNHHTEISQSTLHAIRKLDPKRSSETPLRVVVQRRDGQEKQKGTDRTLPTQGRAYVRVGYSFGYDGYDLPEAQRGLGLKRSLRTQRGPLKPQEALKPGELVALDIELSAESQNRYIAVNIPIPMGLEVVQTDLGTGTKGLQMGGVRGFWIHHEELRKDRVLLFSDLLAPGRHRHTVFLRATSPGTFAMPSALVTNMYKPERFARTRGQTIRVASP